MDQLARHTSIILLATRDAMRNELSPQTLGILAETTRWPLVARAGAVINREVEPTAATSDAAPQGPVDALFDREIEQAFRT